MSPYEQGPYGTVRFGRDEMVQHEDSLADGADPVQPGMLLERVYEDGERKVQPHSTAGEVDVVLIAVEARGRGMNALDGEYSVDGDSYVRYKAVSGGGFHARVAADENVSGTDTLTSNGDGYFAVTGADEDAVVQADEPLDNSGGPDGAFVPTEVI